MFKRLDFWGAFVTAAYFALVWFLIGDKVVNIRTLDLNNIGDFLSGVFGPVAFLWLVLGFLQQGKELKLQAEELRHSVQQQTEIAAATREQAESQRIAMDVDRARYEDQFLARLVFRPKHSMTNNGMRTHFFDLQNLGGDAINLTLGMDPPALGQDLVRLGVLARSAITEIPMDYDLRNGDINATLVLNYETVQGRPQTSLFDFILDSKNSLLTVTRKNA